MIRTFFSTESVRAGNTFNVPRPIQPSGAGGVLPNNRRRPSGFQARHHIDPIKRRAGIPGITQTNAVRRGVSRSGFQYGSVNRGPRHLLPIVSLIATIVRRMTRTGCIAATHRTDKAMCLSGQGFPKGSRSSEHCTRDRIQRYSLYQDTDDCVSLPSVS